MMGRLAVLAALIALAGCAGVESVGRNAQRESAPTPVAQPAPSAQTAPSLPPPQPTAQAAAPAAPAPQPALTAPPPQTAAPPQTAQASPPPRTPQPAQDDDADDNTIVVPGQRDVQVPPPAGDPRSVAERTQDVRAWDRCVTSVQSAYESDPMRPQLETPEEYCRDALGMASRTAVPDSRRTRR